FRSVLRPKYLAATYTKLGWAVPKAPTFIPANCASEAGKPPYAPYGLGVMGRQPFPEPGDLVRPWQFGGKTFNP
ncbi:MAG TPA: hypothetical protein VLW45_04985, partial [Pelomicrobium sp.]|nr:hypothetical protein [Pelomicrobium sp.]